MTCKQQNQNENSVSLTPNSDIYIYVCVCEKKKCTCINAYVCTYVNTQTHIYTNTCILQITIKVYRYECYENSQVDKSIAGQFHHILYQGGKTCIGPQILMELNEATTNWSAGDREWMNTLEDGMLQLLNHSGCSIESRRGLK